jgi:hypothetical protein
MVSLTSEKIGPSPFARAGVHVEGEEIVPDRFGQVAAGEVMDGDAGLGRVPPLAPDHLALARGEGVQEIVEAGIAVVAPVELLVGAFQEALRAEKIPVPLRQEGDMGRRRLPLLAERDQAGRQGIAGGGLVRGRRHHQARAAGRRERHRHLDLGVIAPAGPLIGVGPTLIEDILAARMRFQIAGRGTQNLAVAGLDHEVLRCPAGSPGRRL